jgi:hypothetical protein
MNLERRTAAAWMAWLAWLGLALAGCTREPTRPAKDVDRGKGWEPHTVSRFKPSVEDTELAYHWLSSEAIRPGEVMDEEAKREIGVAGYWHETRSVTYRALTAELRSPIVKRVHTEGQWGGSEFENEVIEVWKDPLDIGREPDVRLKRNADHLLLRRDHFVAVSHFCCDTETLHEVGDPLTGKVFMLAVGKLLSVEDVEGRVIAYLGFVVAAPRTNMPEGWKPPPGTYGTLYLADRRGIVQELRLTGSVPANDTWGPSLSFDVPRDVGVVLKRGHGDRLVLLQRATRSFKDLDHFSVVLGFTEDEPEGAKEAVRRVPLVGGRMFGLEQAVVERPFEGAW